MGFENNEFTPVEIDSKETIKAIQEGDFDQAENLLQAKTQHGITEASDFQVGYEVERKAECEAFCGRNGLAMSMFFDKNFGNSEMSYV